MENIRGDRVWGCVTTGSERQVSIVTHATVAEVIERVAEAIHVESAAAVQHARSE